MTATAALPRTGGPRGTRRALGGAAAALVLGAFSTPAEAQAQWGASLSLDSDYRLRGYSLTDGDPAATAQLTFDDLSGLYANLAGVARFRADRPQFMGVIANVGFARRISANVTLDAGLLRSQVRASDRYARPYHYTEFYAGAAVGRVIGRVYFSPAYRSHDVSTVYAELESGFEPARGWKVSGHVGLLTYLDARPYGSAGATHRDWRVSLSKEIGRVEVHTALSGGGPGRVYNSYREDPKPVVTAGASVSF